VPAAAAMVVFYRFQVLYLYVRHAILVNAISLEGISFNVCTTHEDEKKIKDFNFGC